MKRNLASLFTIASLTAASHAALVAHYNFDNSGNLGANTGSVGTGWWGFSGVTQTTGLFGAGAGNFTPSSNAYNGAFTVGNLNSFSLSMHVKTTQTTAWKDFMSIGTGNNVVFVFEQMADNGVAIFNIGNVGGASSADLYHTPSGGINNGAWHQLGITVGGGTITLFLDGVSRGSTAYTGSGAISAFQLASRFGDGGRAITTEIDDVAVYDTKLNNAQMSWLSSNAAIANPVPEPAAVMLGSLGLLGLLRRRR